jgi:hypothetical protein
MKIIITERQYNLIEQDQELLKIPFDAFSNDWNVLQKYLSRRGDPLYELVGDVDLAFRNIRTLGSLVRVIGNLDLREAPIRSLGYLEYVSGDLNLYDSLLESFGELKFVGGGLVLKGAPIAKKYREYKIRSMINIGDAVFL